MQNMVRVLQRDQTVSSTASDSVSANNLQSSVATRSTVAVRREMQDIRWSGLAASLLQ